MQGEHRGHEVMRPEKTFLNDDNVTGRETDTGRLNHE